MHYFFDFSSYYFFEFIMTLFSIVFVVLVCFVYCLFFARGLDEKKYCTYSFTLVNKIFVRSFVLSLPPSLSL